MRKPIHYWTKEKCSEIALKYKTRNEFCVNGKGAYLFARKNGFLNDICSHMLVLGNLRKRLVYVYEFSDNCAYIGITCNENRRNNQHIKNAGLAGSPVYKHIKETGLIPMKKIVSFGYIAVDLAQKLEHNTVEEYVDKKWIILNKKETGGLGSNILIWTKEKCAEVANKCSSRIEFSKENISAYISCRKNKWLDELCTHMTRPRVPHNYWNYDTCKEATKNTKSRFEFSRKFSRAYIVSLNNG